MIADTKAPQIVGPGTNLGLRPPMFYAARSTLTQTQKKKKKKKKETGPDGKKPIAAINVAKQPGSDFRAR